MSEHTPFLTMFPGCADLKDCGMLFRKGEILRRVDADKLCDALIDLIRKEEGLD